MSHLHEHNRGIVKLVTVPGEEKFASAGLDGYVRLWDIGTFEKTTNLVNRAHKRYAPHGADDQQLTGLATLPELFATGSESGGISVNSWETGQPVAARRQLDVEETGPAMELAFQETDSGGPVLVYGTSYGDIVGWDLRMREDAFRLQNDIKEGIQTALALSPDQSWCVRGTSSGYLTCWDMRFRLPIVKCCHPSEARIRQLLVVASHTASHSAGPYVLASVQGNNEVGLWNMESQFRQLALWASAAPLLSKDRPSLSSVTSMHAIRSPGGLNAVVTAGTDMRIR